MQNLIKRSIIFHYFSTLCFHVANYSCIFPIHMERNRKNKNTKHLRTIHSAFILWSYKFSKQIHEYLWTYAAFTPQTIEYGN